ncbi:MAG: peptide deformylase [Anaerolineae bacterium]|nr:peptide deformylase [Anaerolineae bacterium]
MAIRKIITPENPVLRQKARKVKDFQDPKLQILMNDMVETLLDAPGVGLAAPQVAVSDRVIVVRLPDDEQARDEYGKDAGVLYVVANPEIIRKSVDMVDGVEACLSIPGYYGTVERHVAVSVRGIDPEGNPIRIKARNWLARVFQHEIDHLDGILFIDHAKQIWTVEATEYDNLVEEAENNLWTPDTNVLINVDSPDVQVDFGD